MNVLVRFSDHNRTTEKADWSGISATLPVSQCFLLLILYNCALVSLLTSEL